jgi:hypothetical protein
VATGYNAVVYQFMCSKEASMKRKTVRPHDNKIDLPFDVALGRLLAAKPAKKKTVATKKQRKKRG